MYSVVLDTNVVIAALRSRRGASFAILRRLGQDWEPLLSVALILEYEAVGKREAQRLNIPESTIEAIVGAFCFAGRADAIITYNIRHFAGVERFGIQVLTPREFLRTIEAE